MSHSHLIQVISYPDSCVCHQKLYWLTWFVDSYMFTVRRWLWVVYGKYYQRLFIIYITCFGGLCMDNIPLEPVY